MARWLISDQTPPQALNAARPQVWYGASQVSPEEGAVAPVLPGAGTAAGTLLGTETNGVAFSASDDSMVIRDTVTPANVYVGSPAAKFGSVRISPALQYGSTGLLEWGPENICAPSNNFTTTPWQLNVTTVTPNATTAPDGTTTATFIKEGVTTGGRHLVYMGAPPITVVSGQYYTFSCYLKAGTRHYGGLCNVMALTRSGILFNLDTGAYIGQESSGIGLIYNIADAGNGWWRISVSIISDGVTSLPTVFLQDDATPAWSGFGDTTYNGDGASGIYMWGAQLEHGSVARTYIPTTSSAVYQLRRDYDARVAGPKYLIEEARTNIVLNSQDASAWSTAGAAVGANTQVASDGTTTADTLTLTTTNGYTYQVVGTATAGQVYTWSCFFKKGTSRYAVLGAYNNDVLNWAWFDLNTGLVATPGSGNTCTMLALPNGWYRCIATRTAVAGNLLFNVGQSDTDAVSIGTIGGTTHVWGGSVELGAFASSYIPTLPGATTRAVDNPIIAGTAFPLSQTVGTVYAKSARYGNGTYVHTAVMVASSYNECFGINQWGAGGNNTYAQIASNGGSTLKFVVFSPTAVLGVAKMAGAMQINDLSAALNGTLGTPETTFILPTPLSNLYLGNIPGLGATLQGWSFEGMYLPRRMSNAELTGITT